MSSREKEPALDTRVRENSSSKIEECYARVDGARMRYLRAGSGPAMLLLHGLLGYSFSWRFTIPVLAQHATVYAVDMLGAGFSERVPDLDCRFQALANRLLRFLQVTGITDFDLLATSHGGAVAMLVAAACAGDSALGQLKRLILVAPVNPWSRHGQLWAPFLGSPVGYLLLRSAIRMPSLQEYILRRLYGDSRRISPGTLEGYTAPYKIPGTFDYARSVTRCWRAGLRELGSALPKISAYPTLLIWGSRDRAVYPSSAVPLSKVFNHCELVIFEGVGHLPYEETPEQFNRTVSNFLRSAAR